MQANVLAPLASGAVVAGIIRSTTHCAFCGRAQAGSRYSICPDCQRANPDWQTHPMAQYLVRSASYEPFPARAFNLASLWRTAHANNDSERAFAIAEWVRSRRQLRQPVAELPLSEHERESARAFTERCFTRFAINDGVEHLLWHAFTESADELQVQAGDVPYTGFTIADLVGIDKEAVEQALRYPPDAGEALAPCDEELLDAESFARDMCSHPQPMDCNENACEWHEQCVAKFFVERGLTPEGEPRQPASLAPVPSTLDGKTRRTYRVFGRLHPSGTYSVLARA